MEKFISITHKDVKSLIDAGTLKVIGGNAGQINNQGEFTISKDGNKIYKRRHTARKAMYDLIAQA